jgi:hypothetical protein
MPSSLELTAEKSPLEAGIEAEIERMNQHTSLAPHRQALREANVRDHEARYDEAGRDRTNLSDEFRR